MIERLPSSDVQSTISQLLEVEQVKLSFVLLLSCWFSWSVMLFIALQMSLLGGGVGVGVACPVWRVGLGDG